MIKTHVYIFNQYFFSSLSELHFSNFWKLQGVFLFWHVWHSHILIHFWPKIMFLDIFHIYNPFIFCKKITELLCHYFSFYRIFRKATNFWEIFKNNPFFWTNNNKIAIISTKIFIKIAFFQQQTIQKIPKKFYIDP